MAAATKSRSGKKTAAKSGKAKAFDDAAAQRFIDKLWDKEIVPELCDYIEIPNKSPLFDPDWEKHGFMDQAMDLLEAWAAKQPVDGMSMEVRRLPGRTPLLLIEIEGTRPGNILLYGHMDKQPEFEGWEKGLGPWKPVIRDDKLYGRGGADDGYALFGSLAAIAAVQAQGLSHPRCVIVIEGCEESGSYDLPYYVDDLADRIGEPDLVVCLDSECGDYERFWCTTSLRGMVIGDLDVNVLTEGVHSGMAGGIAPSSFRILRAVLDRIENPKTGKFPNWLEVKVPEERIEQAQQTGKILGDVVWEKFPWADGAQPIMTDPADALIAGTWGMAVSYTGAAGFPAMATAGNVHRPHSALRLSMRLPPTLDSEAAAKRIKAKFEADPPYGAKVEFKVHGAEDGWHAPPLTAKLSRLMKQASRAFFGKPMAFIGVGGGIPFINMLAEKFPKAQFVVTGVLGPKSNAHGPNEFLHIPTGKRVTACVAKILAEL